MSRKTYSLSAVAIAAIASFEFLQREGAVASAQDVADAPDGDAVVEQAPESAPEIMPEQPVFIAQEVVQPLESADDVPAPATEATSLRELVRTVDTDAQLSEQMRCLQARYTSNRAVSRSMANSPSPKA